MRRGSLGASGALNETVRLGFKGTSSYMATVPPARSDPGSVDGVRPKLLCDSVFLPVQGGIFFRSRGRSFTIRGDRAYELVSELAPYMTGRTAVREICRNFPPQEHESIKKLIALLIRGRVAIDHLEETTTIGENVIGAFAGQIAFIEHFARHPVECFTRFRQSRVFLAGSGTSFQTLVLSLIRNGLETIIFDERRLQLEHDSEIASLVRHLRSSDIPISFENMPLDQVTAGNHGLSAVCHAGDISDFRELLRISESCCRQRLAFVPGFLLGGKSFVGPMLQGDNPGCLLCALLRYSACADPGADALFWKHIALGDPWKNDLQPASSPSTRILGNMVAFELFRLRARHIPTETDGFVLSQNLETLETRRSRILPHPLCPHCSKVSPKTDRDLLFAGLGTDSGAKPDLQKKVGLTSRLIDADFGIGKGYEDEELIQTPLFRTSLRLARQPRNCRSVVPGYSIDSNIDARVQAVLEVVRSYSIAMVDERRLWRASRAEAEQASFSPPSDADCTGWTGGSSTSNDRSTFWVDALSLDAGTGCPRAVPAGAIYTDSSFNSGAFEKVNTGIGAGFTFEEACADAAMSLLGHEMLKRVARGEEKLVELNPLSLAPASADVRYIVESFKHLGASFRLVALKHLDGNLVLALPTGEPVPYSQIAVGSATTAEEAAAGAMVDLLGITLGGTSLHTAEHYLPRSLGYHLVLPDIELSGYDKVPVQSAPQFATSDSAIRWRQSIEILIVNLTTPDLASCGLYSVRALAVMHQ